MQTLTKEQRKCFGFSLIENHWHQMEVKATPYEDFKTMHMEMEPL